MEWKLSSNFIDYKVALEEMETRVGDISKGKKDQLIWFLEHDSVYTAGTSAKDDELLERKFPVYKTGRGGKYTYHGPGQRVVYFILDLKKQFAPARPDIRKFIYKLEQVIINTLLEFGVDGKRREGRIGIWVNDKGFDEKIAAIGVRVSKWISYHGIAINLNPDIENFSGIVPCGINEFGVTSLKKIGVECSMEELDLVLKKHISLIFIV